MDPEISEPTESTEYEKPQIVDYGDLELTAALSNYGVLDGTFPRDPRQFS